MTGKLRRFGRDRSEPVDPESADATTADATADNAPDRVEDGSRDPADTSADTSGAGGTSEAAGDENPTESDPTESDPTESDPTESDPTESDPTESDPTESDPTESDPTDPDPTGADSGASDEPVESSDTSPTRARPARRATPAASAASRARRIGGVRTGAGAGAAASSASDSDTADTTTGSRVGTTSRVSTTKTGRTTTRDAAGRSTGAAATGRTASAKALKDQAKGSSAGGVAVVTQVPRWLRWVPGAVLTACAIAMAVVLAVSSHGVWWSTPSAQKTRDQVLAAAKQCTALTNTYAWNTIAADEKRGKACTTGAQSQRYVSAMENIVKPTAPKLHASQTVQINTAGVESITPNGSQWTVVIFGQTTIRQTGASARTDPFSTVVRMDHVHGQWLISSICLITAPNGTQAASC